MPSLHLADVLLNVDGSQLARIVVVAVGAVGRVAVDGLLLGVRHFSCLFRAAAQVQILQESKLLYIYNYEASFPVAVILHLQIE